METKPWDSLYYIRMVRPNNLSGYQQLLGFVCIFYWYLNGDDILNNIF